MPVEFTKSLSPEMQAVADCREAVKKAEAEVEKCKGELKVAKSLLESANEDLNEAVDTVIEAERQPTLFSGVVDDLKDMAGEGEEQGPRSVESEPATGEGGDGVGAIIAVQGEVIDASSEVVPDPEPLALPAATESADEPYVRPAVAAWRRLTLDEAFETEVDIPTEVIAAIKIKGVITVGNLADLLLAGNTFGLRLIDVQAVCEAIELMSADDPEPVKFSSDDEADENDTTLIYDSTSEPVSLLDPVPTEEPPKPKGRGGRRKKSADSEAA